MEPSDYRTKMGKVERRSMDRHHIFCVNGAPAFLDVLRELFQEEDFNVTTTNFVPETEHMITALKPALVLIDLEIGRQAGWELLERLAHTAATRDIPVVITSTDRRLLDSARADPERYGGQAFLVKPLDINALVATVRRLLNGAAGRA